MDGLRAWLKKEGLAYVQKEDADILCLQETKCSTEKVPMEIKNLEGYEKFWCSSDKEGYAGVALFTKQSPVNVAYGIGVEEFDSDGRCITAEYKNFYVVNVYVPNSGSIYLLFKLMLSYFILFFVINVQSLLRIFLFL